MFRFFVGISIILFFSSCSDSGTNSNDINATYTEISTQIFDVSCSCHLSAGGTPVVLKSDQAYLNIVGQPSSQNSNFLRVNPGNPDDSYLYMKITGDERITGLRMPRNGPPYLSDEQIEAIREWIADGAQNN